MVWEVPGGDTIRGIDVSVGEGEPNSAYCGDWVYNDIQNALDDDGGTQEKTRRYNELSSKTYAMTCHQRWAVVMLAEVRSDRPPHCYLGVSLSAKAGSEQSQKESVCEFIALRSDVIG